MVYSTYSENKINNIICLNYSEEQPLIPESDTFKLIYYEQKSKWEVLYKNDWGQVINFDAEVGELQSFFKNKTGNGEYEPESFFKNQTPETINGDGLIEVMILSLLQDSALVKYVPYENIYIVKDDVFNGAIEGLKKKRSDADIRFIKFINQNCCILKNALQCSIVEAINNFKKGKLSIQLFVSLLTTYSFLEKRLKTNPPSTVEEKEKYELINAKLEKQICSQHSILDIKGLANFIKSNIELFPILSKSTRDNVLDILGFCSEDSIHGRRNILLSKLLIVVVNMVDTINKYLKQSNILETLAGLSHKYKCSKERILQYLVKNNADLLVKINANLNITTKFDQNNSWLPVFPEPYSWFGNVDIFPKADPVLHITIKEKLAKHTFYKLASTYEADKDRPTNYFEELIKKGVIDRTKEAQKKSYNLEKRMYLDLEGDDLEVTRIYLEIPDEEDPTWVIRAYGYRVSVDDITLTLDDVRVPDIEITKLDELLSIDTTTSGEQNKEKPYKHKQKRTSVINELIEKIHKELGNNSKTTVASREVWSELKKLTENADHEVLQEVDSWTKSDARICYISHRDKGACMKRKSFENIISKLNNPPKQK